MINNLLMKAKMALKSYQKCHKGASAYSNLHWNQLIIYKL